MGCSGGESFIESHRGKRILMLCHGLRYGLTEWTKVQDLVDAKT
jgi:hypothetical protein